MNLSFSIDIMPVFFVLLLLLFLPFLLSWLWLFDLDQLFCFPILDQLYCILFLECTLPNELFWLYRRRLLATPSICIDNHNKAPNTLIATTGQHYRLYIFSCKAKRVASSKIIRRVIQCSWRWGKYHSLGHLPTLLMTHS